MMRVHDISAHMRLDISAHMRLATLLLACATSGGSSVPMTDLERRLPRGRHLVDVNEALKFPTHIVNEAYVTFLTNVPYMPGVEALLQSIAETGTRAPFLVLVPHPVPSDLNRALEKVIECSKSSSFYPPVQVVHVPSQGNPYNPTQSRWGGSIMSKIYIFSERVGARRIVYLDPDVLVLRNIDHLFARVKKGALSASSDNGLAVNNGRPNTGVIGTMPDEYTMGNLLDTLGKIPSYDGADQGFLTSYFVYQKRQGGWDHLPTSYNTLKRRYFHSDYNFEHIHCLHLVGKKPWQRNVKEDKDYYGPHQLWKDTHARYASKCEKCQCGWDDVHFDFATAPRHPCGGKKVRLTSGWPLSQNIQGPAKCGDLTSWQCSQFVLVTDGDTYHCAFSGGQCKLGKACSPPPPPYPPFPTAPPASPPEPPGPPTTVCPKGYLYAAQNLDGPGKRFHECPEPRSYWRCFGRCATFCDAIEACTSFEFNGLGDERYLCATYTGGDANLKTEENGATWSSCKRLPRPPATSSPAAPSPFPPSPWSPQDVGASLTLPAAAPIISPTSSPVAIADARIGTETGTNAENETTVMTTVSTNGSPDSISRSQDGGQPDTTPLTLGANPPVDADMVSRHLGYGVVVALGLSLLIFRWVVMSSKLHRWARFDRSSDAEMPLDEIAQIHDEHSVVSVQGRSTILTTGTSLKDDDVGLLNSKRPKR